jgi:hypothetical protein
MAPLILEISTRGLHRYETIEQEVTRVGRALDNDIILSDPTVAPHHLKIIRYGDNSVEIVNLTEVNPTRIDGQRQQSLVTERLPVALEIGRVHAQLLARDFEVAPTRALAGGGRRGHLFGHVSWAVILVMLCLLAGGLEFYLNAYNAFKWSDLLKYVLYNAFKWSDLLKYVLRETVLAIGAFVLALSILERLLVNRWEIRQLVTSISLIYLLYYLMENFTGMMQYLFSADWPTILFRFGWNLALIPAAIALYLVYISHLKKNRAIMLAILIASPIALPSILQSPELKTMLEDFSSAARYQNSLSSMNIHLGQRVSIETFVEQAQNLGEGAYAD